MFYRLQYIRLLVYNEKKEKYIYKDNVNRYDMNVSLVALFISYSNYLY